MDQTIPTQLQLITHELGQLCLKKSLKIVTAESCTGGGVAYELTSVPGSSQWFERGFVTYSDMAKMELLGVQEKSILNYGAVSRTVAKEMAEGAIKNSRADVSLAITGIAGPKGGNKEKPIGTCWFGWAGANFETQGKHTIFQGDRNLVRLQAMIFSLKELLQLIEMHY